MSKIATLALEPAAVTLGRLRCRIFPVTIKLAVAFAVATLLLIPVVGDAIIRYIKEVRFNEGGCEYIFTRRRAPHGRLSANTMYTIISKILKKHDIQIRHYGPHSLRHGRATQLINAKHSLKDIADILGHMSLDTTAVYAKVNITTLREVADINWEGIL